MNKLIVKRYKKNVIKNQLNIINMENKLSNCKY